MPLRGAMGISLETFQNVRPSALWTRVLAAIGVFLLLERSLTYWHWSSNQDHPFSAIGNFGAHFTDPSNGQDSIRKSIVVASISKEHTQWVNRNFPDWEINTYIVDDEEANYTVYKNAGREATVYLTYIINHYWDLPDVMVFIHAERYQWHNDDPMFDGVPPIQNLRLDHVRKEGYVSLRCAHFPGCMVGVHPTPNKPDDFWGMEHSFAVAFQEFFPTDPIPTQVGAPCCAQFAVSKETVQSRSPAEYERMRQWLWSTTIVGGKSGRVFEYLWHYIFRKPAVFCPTADECYCKVFGHCDLKCPAAPGRCQGRYRIPPYDSPIPLGWPKQGQGRKGYPMNGWWREFYPKEEYDDNFKLRVGSKTPQDLYPEGELLTLTPPDPEPEPEPSSSLSSSASTSISSSISINPNATMSSNPSARASQSSGAKVLISSSLSNSATPSISPSLSSGSSQPLSADSSISASPSILASPSISASPSITPSPSVSAGLSSSSTQTLKAAQPGGGGGRVGGGAGGAGGGKANGRKAAGP